MTVERDTINAYADFLDRSPDDDDLGRVVEDDTPWGPLVVFLDIDGVLNSSEWDRDRPRGTGHLRHFDPAAVARLNRLTDTTSASLVISSSWRQFGEEYVTRMLRSAGVTAPIVGVTPVLDDGSRIMRPVPRGHEIMVWLDTASFVPPRFVILDDEDDMRALGRRLVRTDHSVGMTDADVDRAIALLLPTDDPSSSSGEHGAGGEDA